MLDSADLDAIDGVVGEVEDTLGPVDILVCNTGGPPGNPDPLSFSREQWEAAYRTLVLAQIALVERVLPGMRERGFGRIVTVASAASHAGSRYTSGYTASKHAVLGFMRSVAAEIAGTGVTANSVCPAYVRSDMTDQTIANIQARTGQEGEAALVAMTPLGRLVEPEEVAFAVAFFAADEAGAINGQTLIIDGGGVQQ